MKRPLRSHASRIVHESLTVLTLAALITSSSIARADGASLADVAARVAGASDDGHVDDDARSESDADVAHEGWSLDPVAHVASSFAPTALLAGIGLSQRGMAASGTAVAKASGAASTDPGGGSSVGSSSQGDEGAGMRIAGYLAGGVGIAGLALFAVAGLGAKNTFDKLESDCGTSPCDDVEHRSNIEEGRMLQTAANIGLAVGVVGVGLGATLIVIGRRPLEDKPNEKVAVSVVGGPGAISLRGSF